MKGIDVYYRYVVGFRIEVDLRNSGVFFIFRGYNMSLFVRATTGKFAVFSYRSYVAVELEDEGCRRTMVARVGRKLGSVGEELGLG
jgi:hypothetical protein